MIIPSITSILAWLVSSGGIGGFLYWLLKRKLEDRFTRELEKTRHELQLEQQRMSIVFEHQKDSLRNVLVAMHRALKAVADKWDEGDWGSISAEDVEIFKQVVSEERLFMDTGSDHALQLFASAMWNATDPRTTKPEVQLISHAHSEMAFISERLADHFRTRVGLCAADPTFLLDIEVLGACHLINCFHLLGDTSPLRFLKDEGAEEQVTRAKQHMTLLKSEITKLRDLLAEDKDMHVNYYHSLIEADRYLRTFNNSRELSDKS